MSDAASLPGLVEAGYMALQPGRPQLPSASGSASAAAMQLPATPAVDNAEGLSNQMPALMVGGDPARKDPSWLTAAAEPTGEIALSAAITAAANGVSSQLPASALTPGGVDPAAAPLQPTELGEPPTADPPMKSGPPQLPEDGTVPGKAVQDPTRASTEAADRALLLPAHPLSDDAAVDVSRQPHTAEPAEQGGEVGLESDDGQRTADIAKPADLQHATPGSTVGPVTIGGSGAAEPSGAAGVDATADVPAKDAGAAVDGRRSADDAEAALKAAAPEAEGPLAGVEASVPEAVTGLPRLPACQGAEPGTYGNDTQVLCHPRALK